MSEQNSDLCTVKQLSARHPAFSEASLRYHIFNAKSRTARGGVRTENGLEAALVRVGRKVLISESGFLAWIQRGATKAGDK